MFYAKTEEGQFAAYNAGSAMPRKLKTLLMAVNGKTDSTSIVQSLSAFGDVQALLDSLEMAGLIVRLEGPDFSSTQSMRTTAHGLHGITYPRADAAALAPQDWNSTLSSAGLTAAEMEAALAPKVPKSVLDTMSDFVLTHLPRQSFSLLATLEAVRTMAQLEDLLVQYEPIALLAGDAGQEHLRMLRRAVPKAFSAQ